MYCDKFRNACDGDSTALKYLVAQNYYDGASYEHGYVISIVIDSIGEDVVVQLVDNQYIDRAKLKSYLWAGQNWRAGRASQMESVEERYPLLFR